MSRARGTRSVVRLAAGVRLDGGTEKKGGVVLVCANGNVQLNRGQNQVNGSRLVIDLDSGRAVIDGGPPGVNQSGGRVTGHFSVPQKNNGS